MTICGKYRAFEGAPWILIILLSAVLVVCREQHCMNERYLFIVIGGCFFACTQLLSLLHPGYYHLTFPPLKVLFLKSCF